MTRQSFGPKAFIQNVSSRSTRNAQMLQTVLIITVKLLCWVSFTGDRGRPPSSLLPSPPQRLPPNIWSENNRRISIIIDFIPLKKVPARKPTFVSLLFAFVITSWFSTLIPPGIQKSSIFAVKLIGFT